MPYQLIINSILPAVLLLSLSAYSGVPASDILAWCKEGNRAELEKCSIEDMKNVKDKHGANAVLYAAQGGQKEVLEWLADTKGLNLTHRDNEGANAVLHAARGGHRILKAWLQKQTQP